MKWSDNTRFYSFICITLLSLALQVSPSLAGEVKRLQMNLFRGPASGGTRITINVTGLDVKHAFIFNREISTLDPLECEIDNSSLPHELTIITPALSFPGEAEYLDVKSDIFLGLKDSEKPHHLKEGEVIWKFMYLRDPFVRDVYPDTFFESGGKNITIVGDHLHSVMEPKVYFWEEERITTVSDSDTEYNFTVGFDVTSTTKHMCNTTVYQEYKTLVALSPDVKRRNESIPEVTNETTHEYLKEPLPETASHVYNRFIQLVRGKQRTAYFIGLDLDGIKSFTNRSQVYITPDPVIEMSDNILVFDPFHDRNITLKGKELNNSAVMADYEIMIRDSPCKVVFLNETAITCEPAKHKLTTEEKKEFNNVTVRIGRFLKYTGGSVKYYPTIDPFLVLVAILVAALVFIAAIVAIGVYCAVRSYRNTATAGSTSNPGGLQMQEMPGGIDLQSPSTEGTGFNQSPEGDGDQPPNVNPDLALDPVGVIDLEEPPEQPQEVPNDQEMDIGAAAGEMQCQGMMGLSDDPDDQDQVVSDPKHDSMPLLQVPAREDDSQSETFASDDPDQSYEDELLDKQQAVL